MLYLQTDWKCFYTDHLSHSSCVAQYFLIAANQNLKNGHSRGSLWTELAAVRKQFILLKAMMQFKILLQIFRRDLLRKDPNHHMKYLTKQEPGLLRTLQAFLFLWDLFLFINFENTFSSFHTCRLVWGKGLQAHQPTSFIMSSSWERKSATLILCVKVFICMFLLHFVNTTWSAVIPGCLMHSTHKWIRC